MASDKPTLARLDAKLEIMIQQVEKLVYSLDGNGKPGLKTRIELAENDIRDMEASKARQTKAVWSVLVFVAGAILVKFFIG